MISASLNSLRSSTRFFTQLSKMSKTALLILAEGAEEMEVVIPTDVLRRAGVEVTVAGLTGTDVVKCSRGVLIKPDQSLAEAANGKQYDAVILPGGLQGAKNLAASAEVGLVIKQQDSAHRIVAAICAGPTVLKSHGVGYGKSVTSHPVVKAEMEKDGCYKYLEDIVVEDGHIVTSRGPGTAFQFALKIVEKLQGKEKVADIVRPMLLNI